MGGAGRVILDAVAAVRAIQPSWEFTLIAPAAGALTEEARALGIAVKLAPFPRALATVGDAETADGQAGSGLNRWRTLGRLGASGPAIAAYIPHLARVVAETQP